MVLKYLSDRGLNGSVPALHCFAAATIRETSVDQRGSRTTKGSRQAAPLSPRPRYKIGSDAQT
jgi:hypothetical protein